MISYNKATLHDIKTILELEKQCFNKYDCFSKRIIKHFLINPHNSIIVDLIKYNDNIVGYSVYLTRKNSNIIRLYSLCITPEYRGKKIAFNYLKERISYFTNKYFQLVLEVRVSNSSAINLYKKLGFQEKCILLSYYKDGENGLRLSKDLI